MPEDLSVLHLKFLGNSEIQSIKVKEFKGYINDKEWKKATWNGRLFFKGDKTAWYPVVYQKDEIIERKVLYCESHDLDHGYFAKEDHYDVEYNYEYMRLREKVFFNTTQITD
jgi:hypothetical protein